MDTKRIAIVGSGNMALARGQAFLDTGRASICAVASRRSENAKNCAEELGCELYFDDYTRLKETNPDAVLIELPHKIQDEVALWSLDQGFDVLIGGVLAASLKSGKRIAELADRHKLVVEAGFQRRYDPAWEEIRRLVKSGELGEPVMAVSMGLWRPDPASWYYDQALSAGMPLTHMSYVYLNAMRWILGTPLTVAAMANRKLETGQGRVVEESCGALIRFTGGAFLSVTASYAGLEGLDDARTQFVCTKGAVRVEVDGSITIFREGHIQHHVFTLEPSPMVRQADEFLDAINCRGLTRNPPDESLWDIRIASAISAAASSLNTISLTDF